MKRWALICFIGVAVLGTLAFAAEESKVTEDNQFADSLIELTPQVGFLSLHSPVDGVDTKFSSTMNPGAIARFTPIWRNKFPIYFHLSLTRVTMENDAGATVQGEHGNMKYLWSFGSRLGFRPFNNPDFVFSTGMEFNHDAFMTEDPAPSLVTLNKVLLPTIPFLFSWQFLRGQSYTAVLDLGVKAHFTVALDTWMMRRGFTLQAKATGRFPVGSDLKVVAGLLLERRYYNASYGELTYVNTGLEVGIGWGYGN